MKIYNKKLYKSRENRIFAGVIGGLGEYFGIDPALLRIVYIGFSIFSAVFPGILTYILMVIIIPNKPAMVHEESRT